MSAFDILEKLEGIEPHALGSLQRILLITDGTLTEILEAHFLERIRLIKLSQQTVVPNPSHADLAASEHEKLLERQILLQGASSGKNYVYAKSAIAVGRLPVPLRDALMNSDMPLGRVWLEQRLETFKELIEVRCQPADDLCRYFSCDSSALLLTRTYRVFTGAKPVMIISEYFRAE